MTLDPIREVRWQASAAWVLVARLVVAVCYGCWPQTFFKGSASVTLWLVRKAVCWAPSLQAMPGLRQEFAHSALKKV